MRKMSPTMLDALERNAQKEFVRFTADAIRDELPEYSLKYDGDSLEELIYRSIQNADKFGIKKQRSVFKFSCLAVLAGENFHAEPAVKELLGEEAIPPCDRVDFLYAEIRKNLENM